jgi:hypothetical protein
MPGTYIYLPDRVNDDPDVYCSHCGEEAIFSELGRRSEVEEWIRVLKKHLTCPPGEGTK